MGSEKRLRLNNGRVFVAAFLTLMGVLFTLSGLVFQEAPPRWTLLGVAALMFAGGVGSFALALRERASRPR